MGRLPDNPKASEEYLESPYIVNIKTEKGEKYTISLYGEGFGGESVRDLEDKIVSGTEIRISKKSLESIRKGDRVSYIHTSNLKLD